MGAWLASDDGFDRLATSVREARRTVAKPRGAPWLMRVAEAIDHARVEEVAVAIEGGVAVTMRDITGRKRDGAGLRASEEAGAVGRRGYPAGGGAEDISEGRTG